MKLVHGDGGAAIGLCIYGLLGIRRFPPFPYPRNLHFQYGALGGLRTRSAATRSGATLSRWDTRSWHERRRSRAQVYRESRSPTETSKKRAL